MTATGGENMRKMLPSVFTVGNLVLGMTAVLLCLNGRDDWAAIVVLAGMAVDGVDGRLARALGVESGFGRELDSLADIVTFGAAPAAIMYEAQLRDLGLFGAAVAILFAVAGAVRLARFNILSGQERHFVGLPITAAGGIMAAFSLSRGLVSADWLPVVSLVVTFLMISRVRYPNFKKMGLPRTAFAVVPLLALFAASALARARWAVPGLIAGGVLLYGAFGVWSEVRALLRRVHRGRPMQGSEEL